MYLPPSLPPPLPMVSPGVLPICKYFTIHNLLTSPREIKRLSKIYISSFLIGEICQFQRKWNRFTPVRLVKAVAGLDRRLL
jgi:hypothetical protein